MINEPKKIILHCADTPDFKKGDRRFDSIGAAEIDEWHRARGFDCIGYHDVIRQSGLIERGRDLNVIGAHAYGHNKNSIGICLVGSRLFTEPQFYSLGKLYLRYREMFGITSKDWFGHYEVSDIKTCPNVSLHLIRRLFASEYENERIL